MYAYCENNPINRIDPSGNSWFSAIVNTVKNVVQQVANVVNVIVNTVKSVVKTVVNTVTPKNNIVLANKNKLPTTGKPNSSVKNSKGDSSIWTRWKSFERY